MSHQHIIFIPGKNPKPQPEKHRALLWRTLIEGVNRAYPEVANNLKSKKDVFHLVAWNYQYYHVYRDIEYDLPWIDALLNKHGPTEWDIKQANSWLTHLSRYLYLLADHLPFLIRWLPEAVKMTIQETDRYFYNKENIGYETRGMLKKILRPIMDAEEPVLIIGHSMGSIIAYDCLWEMSHNESHIGKVDLLTIGSPLGLNFVQHKLQGRQYKGKHRYPNNIRHWYNLSSVGDLTSLDRCFKNDFREMLTYEVIESINDYCGDIYNFFHGADGLNCHRSYGYLVNPAVGEIIAEWWKKNSC